LSSRIGKGYIKPHKYVLSVLQSFTLSIPMQQSKARSNGKGTIIKVVLLILLVTPLSERAKGEGVKGEHCSITNIVSNTTIIKVTQYKGQRAKDRLKIYYNSLINNVLDGGASET
jgi:hypothetical protein